LHCSQSHPVAIMPLEPVAMFFCMYSLRIALPQLAHFSLFPDIFVGG